MTWYLAYAKGGKELEVATDLRDDGVEVWCGTIDTERHIPKSSRSGPRVEIVTEPALPNYLFLSLSDSQFHTVGHKHLRKTLSPLTSAGVREFQDFANRIESMELLKDLEPGALLAIVSGPLKDQMVTLSKLVNADTIEADTEFFGVTRTVRIGTGDIKLAS